MTCTTALISNESSKYDILPLSTVCYTYINMVQDIIHMYTTITHPERASFIGRNLNRLLT